MHKPVPDADLLGGKYGDIGGLVMIKRGSTKTDIARQMLIDGIGEPIQYDDIARRTGMLVSSLRSLVSTMRKKGLLPAYEPESYEYVGISDALGVVKFRTLADAAEQGFPATMVSKAVNGIIDSYAGYKWERVAK